MLLGSDVLVDWLENASWTVPVTGAAVCLLAYLVGRAVLPGKRQPAPPPAEDPGATFLKGITRDRRAAHRRTGNPIEVLLGDGGEDPPRVVLVTDRSAGGVQLLVNDPLPQGGRYKIRAVHADTSTPWLDILVRSCRPRGTQYEVGCQFPHPPAWNLLLQLG